LIGQPQLRKRLNDPDLSQLTQRVSVYYHLAPLDKAEVTKYIDHRLKVSGRTTSAPLFTESAIDKIYAYSGGIPRLISSICDTALLYGYTDDLKHVDAGIIESVIKNRGIQSGFSESDSGEAASDSATANSGRSSPAADQLKKRLTSIEQRIERLEAKDNQDVIMQLMKSLNNLHRENAMLRKKYYTLLKEKEGQPNGKATSDKRTSKFSPISIEKKKS
jgi:general secretion pathway protein A